MILWYRTWFLILNLIFRLRDETVVQNWIVCKIVKDTSQVFVVWFFMIQICVMWTFLILQIWIKNFCNRMWNVNDRCRWYINLAFINNRYWVFFFLRFIVNTILNSIDILYITFNNLNRFSVWFDELWKITWRILLLNLTQIGIILFSLSFRLFWFPGFLTPLSLLFWRLRII